MVSNGNRKRRVRTMAAKQTSNRIIRLVRETVVPSNALVVLPMRMPPEGLVDSLYDQIIETLPKDQADLLCRARSNALRVGHTR